jgi:SAM-dependent methyltransferase
MLSLAVNVFFDVDDTLITWDVRLRPGVHEIFGRLREDGHVLYLWSGYGPRWEVVRRFELHEHVIDCFWKPLHNHHARLAELKVPFVPDYVIDDHREVVDAFGGTHIRPAPMSLESDREMWRVYEEITRFATGRENGK